jgi:transcriptional regulator with XRE-family HTH domain
LGEFVRVRREDLKMTQDDLSELIGAPRGYVSQIETGTKKWPRSYIGRLAKALRVTEEVLKVAAGRSETRQGIREQVAEVDLSKNTLTLGQLIDAVTDKSDPEQLRRWQALQEIIRDMGDVILTPSSDPSQDHPDWIMGPDRDEEADE